MGSADSIGLSGLLTSQRLLDLVGQNIANAQTPGFHRQVGNLAVRTAGQGDGFGVEITLVRRLLDRSIEAAITNNTSLARNLTTQLDGLRQVETTLNPTEGSVHDLLSQFFDQIELLAGQPDDVTQRRTLLTTANTLAGKLNSALAASQEQMQGVRQLLEHGVAQVNSLVGRIAALNDAVKRNTIQGINANALSDQRDQLINELAQWIDVRVVPQPHGSVNVMAAGVPVVLGDATLQLHANVDAQGQAVITADGINTPINVTGGNLRGLLELRNHSLADVIASLKSLAQTFAQQIDGMHATGIGLSGPFTILNGQRGVTNPNLPLALAGLAFPPQAGSLFVSVTNLATGQRTLTEVAIDPATQSLQDVATALSGVANLNAVVDPQTNTLTVVAQPGFAFDFAGRLPTAPQTVAFTGTSVPQISGTYTGGTNDTLTYSVVGSGTVGVTPNLALEARNAAGALVGSWNIGQGYEPGAPLDPFQGISVRMAAGTVNNGDSFTTDVVANSDTAGLLAALGMNTFFEGGVGDLKVRADLLQHPELLAASRTGLPSDGANLRQLSALRDQPLFGGGTTSFQEFYADLAANVGSRVQNLEQRQTAEEALGLGLEAERQSISGVDPNEELVKLVQYQRSFQMSARFLSVVNDTLQDLFQLV